MNSSASKRTRIALLTVVTLLFLSTFGVVSAQEASSDSLPEAYNEDYNEDYTVLSREVTDAGINTVIRVNDKQDTFLSSANPNTAYGWFANLRFGWESGTYDALRMMIQFDLSGIPANAHINGATLYIYQAQSIPSNDSSMTYRAQYVTQPWNEYGATWNNANYLGGASLPLGSVSNADGWKAGDVTSLIHTWQSGAQPNHGLIITGDETPSNNRSRVFYSREQASFQPYITVDYTTQCDTVPPQANVNSLPQYELGTFEVTWQGQDYAPSGCQPSGIAYYDVYYRINGGSWTHWKEQTQATSQHFKNYANNGAFVELTATATDKAGNVQPLGGPQASTTIDTEPPTTFINPLPATTTQQVFTVNWGGSDNLSGIKWYDFQARVNNGNWITLLEETTQTSYQVTGAQSTYQYDFRVRATDNVGNIQDFPNNPQATTVVSLFPSSTILPFEPPIIKPTDLVTETFNVNWTGTAAGGTSITSFAISYKLDGGTAWMLWKTFPGTVFSAVFPWKDMGLSDGAYGFRSVATNNLGQSQPPSSAAQAVVYVDMADEIDPVGYLPFVPTED